MNPDTAALAAGRTVTAGKRSDSTLARRMFDDLMSLTPIERRPFIEELALLAAKGDPTLTHVLAIAQDEMGTPYGLWQDDAHGFVTTVLGENTWSTTTRLFEALSEIKARVAIPSCFSSGKTHSASRAVLWFTAVHPVGQALAITLAPLWRQVEKGLWPEIRGSHRRCGLPGQVDMTQMKAESIDGLDTLMAYGIAAAPHNEAAVQGIHKPKLLLIVDEAGGISRNIGRNLRGLLTGPDSRLLAIGNPPTDDEGSWFERLCEDDAVVTLPISAYSTPAFTDEQVGLCGSCPKSTPPHAITEHLVDPQWVEEVREEYGEDSAYFQAKVLAKFPKGGSNRVIPASWVDLALDSPEPDTDDEEWLRLCDLGIDGETDQWAVKAGSWVRLGVDVAADGGDEFVIVRTIGNLSTIEHTSSGLGNADPVDVAGVVLREIKRAEKVRQALGTAAKVRVKIDGIGVGWGVAGILSKWGTESVHDAEIVSVIVSEAIDREADGSTETPYNKRAEMWLAGRAVLTPAKQLVEQDDEVVEAAFLTSRFRLRMNRRAAAQLSNPIKGNSSTGKTVVESKDKMKKRGVTSPDRAEAWLLSIYEPAPSKPKRKQGKLLA
jgi:hypothetical protein